ncbi:MAG TPA: S9 family peptidase [Flavipsychrobacter sp.]|nr:S9 family peptidase [Flavipsychrobacter sp.]
MGVALLNLFSFSLMAQRNPIGNLLVEGVGDIPAAVSERLEQYQNIRGADVADWDAAGKGIYITTRFADVAQIHHIGKPGAYREQITFFKEPVTGISTCPNAMKNGFLYSRDIGGNEQFQIYYFDRGTGLSTMLTDGKSRNMSPLWNKKGDKIVFASTRRTGKDLDFYIAFLNHPSDAKLTLENKGGGWSVMDWSDDDTRMIVCNATSVNESKLYILDIVSGKLEEINPSEKQISYTKGGNSARFSKDGKGIFMISDEDTEVMTLCYYDIATRKMKKIAAIHNDADKITLSDDGSKLVFVANEGGYSKPYLMNTQTFKYAPLNLVSSGLITNVTFNKDNNRIAFGLSAPNQAAEVYVHDLKTSKTERWTFSETAGLNPANFSPTTLIEYPTFDKDEQTGKTRMIPSFLITPKNASGKLPVLIQIHGGPESQSMANFNALNQYWANELGIAVLVPNVRGSTGYGKSYLKLDNGVLRENSVKDIGALLDWIATQPNLDASRVAVSGGSYGGYMSLACMTHYNDRLRCGIDLFGISNFVSFLKNTSGYRADLRRVEYGDERDAEMAAYLTKISPLTNIKNITKPMFIYQGENDPRVPLSESEQMVEALKQNGVSVSYVRAKDEGHGIAKKANRDYTLAAMSLFLKKYLVGN